MYSPLLLLFVSNLRPVPPVISIVTFAPSIGWPFSSVTTPLTIPVDCANAGTEKPSEATSARTNSQDGRPLIRRTILSS